MAEKEMVASSFRSARFLTVSRIILLAVVVSITGLMVSCDQFTGHIEGEVVENQAPWVEFANVPADSDAFRYAPVVYWKGGDKDGFVEYYLYADVTDSAALNDPLGFVELIPPEAWIRTSNTADTVYLLSESGDLTEHIFYLKCVDDRGAESEEKYRKFFRTNDPPYVPQVKWYASNDESFDHDVLLEDTLYVLDEINETWPGLGFTWRSSDPDDRDLYTIPLEYRYYLEKVPHDTVWEWVAPNWSDDQDLTITGLETGHYKLTIWVRDDGLEISERPASITFDVYRPLFEETLLIFDCTRLNSTPPMEGLGNVRPGTQIGEFYRALTDSISDQIPNYTYIHSTEYGDTTLYKSFLGRFRLVMWISENQQQGFVSDDYEIDLRNYAYIGGNLWVNGSFLGLNLISNTTMALGESIIGSSYGVPNDDAEFMGTTAGVSDLPDLTIDTSKTGETWRIFFSGNFGVYPLLPGVDILTAGSGAETAYYFQSYTDTASGDVNNDRGRVVVNVDTIYYPPTPLGCLVRIDQQRIRLVSRIENITRQQMGEVISVTNNVGNSAATVVRVSYESGEPWALTDTIQVDYQYLPYSDNHFRPCGIRYERLAQLRGEGYEIRYRVAVFTFPMYFLDNSTGSVTRMYRSMLNWFFLPYAH